MPGLSPEKFMVLPFLSNIGVFLGTLNLMIEARFPSLAVVKLRFSLSTFKILPVIVLSETGLLTIRIR